MKTHYRNKYILGDFNLGDLLKVAALEGDFTIGSNWLPIVVHRISRRRKTLLLFMDSLCSDAEVEIPLSARVRVEGRVAHMRVDGHGYPTHTNVRIRFDREIGLP